MKDIFKLLLSIKRSTAFSMCFLTGCLAINKLAVNVLKKFPAPLGKVIKL